MAEHLFYTQGVGGSIPSFRTIIPVNRYGRIEGLLAG